MQGVVKLNKGDTNINDKEMSGRYGDKTNKGV